MKHLAERLFGQQSAISVAAVKLGSSLMTTQARIQTGFPFYTLKNCVKENLEIYAAEPDGLNRVKQPKAITLLYTNSSLYLTSWHVQWTGLAANCYTEYNCAHSCRTCTTFSTCNTNLRTGRRGAHCNKGLVHTRVAGLRWAANFSGTSHAKTRCLLFHWPLSQYKFTVPCGACHSVKD